MSDDIEDPSAAGERVRARMRVHLDLPSPPERRLLRHAVGLSLAEVAKAVGVTQQAVSLWELGERTPRGVVLDRYVAALNAMREVDDERSREL